MQSVRHHILSKVLAISPLIFLLPDVPFSDHQDESAKSYIRIPGKYTS
jgi:hypothetical protein